MPVTYFLNVPNIKYVLYCIKKSKNCKQTCKKNPHRILFVSISQTFMRPGWHIDFLKDIIVPIRYRLG